MIEFSLDKNKLFEVGNTEYVINHLIRIEMKERGIPVIIPLTNLKDDSLRVEYGRLLMTDHLDYLTIRWVSE